MVIFLFTCCVVLLNILIAQLSDTYQNVQRDAQRGLELNRAWIIARVELNSLFIGKVIFLYLPLLLAWLFLFPHLLHQNDSCIKMGSDESHFNVSVGSDGQSHRTVSTNHNLFEEKGEPKRGIEPRSFRLPA